MSWRNGLLYILIVLFVGLLLSGSIYIAIDRFSDFAPNFASDFLATLIAVVIGIPVALWIAKYQDERETERQQAKILNRLREELLWNRRYIKSAEEHRQEIAADSFIGLRPKYENWKAISDGGELRWIKDVDLLVKVSDAYYALRHLEGVTKDYASKNWGESIEKSILEVLKLTIAASINHLIIAIEEIDKHLT